jgi:tRNA uridine 5-carbamoylmethylation protein Kti12
MNVVIMSGPPGSGKTWQAQKLAASLAADGEDGMLVSADHHHCLTLREALAGRPYLGCPLSRVNDDDFKDALTSYKFDVAQLSAAHQACMKAFVFAVEGGVPNVIVDNTNIHNYEIAPYYLVGEAFGYKVEIVRVHRGLDVCIEQNTHDVPSEVVTRMSETFNATKPHPWEPGRMMPVQHMPWWTWRDV